MSVFISLFQSSSLQGLKEFWIEQECQILHVSIAMALYSQKEEGIDQMFRPAFVDKKLTITMSKVQATFRRLLALNRRVLSGQGALSTNTIRGASFLPFAHVGRRLHLEEAAHFCS